MSAVETRARIRAAIGTTTGDVDADAHADAITRTVLDARARNQRTLDQQLQNEARRARTSQDGTAGSRQEGA